MPEKQSLTSRSRDFCSFFGSLGIDIGKSGIGKKFSVSVSKIWYQKKVSVLISENLVSVLVSENLVSENLVSENLVSDKKSRYRSRKIWSRIKSLCISIG